MDIVPNISRSCGLIGIEDISSVGQITTTTGSESIEALSNQSNSKVRVALMFAVDVDDLERLKNIFSNNDLI